MGWFRNALGGASVAGAGAAVQVRTLPDPGTAVATAQWDLIDRLGITRGGINWQSYGRGMSTKAAMAIPSVARGVGLLSGLVRQCPLDRVVNGQVVDRPRLLDQPDPNRSRSWFVGQHLVDYLIHGNAVSYVTVRGADGWPLAAVWLPARRVAITTDRDGVDWYTLDGKPLNTRDVIHVRRGADEDYPTRGVGILEQHCATLHRVSDQEAYEANILNGAGVPSVAITSPNAQVSQDEIDLAKQSWDEKFSGPRRRPALFPVGTVITPLGWSPADSELTAARQMGLTDVANMINMDGYWVNAPASGMTYRSAGPKYLELMRQTLEPIFCDFEGEWSSAWLPRGSGARFERSVLLTDDMQTTVQTWVQASGGPVATLNEARDAMRLRRVVDPAADIVNDPIAPNVTVAVGGGQPPELAPAVTDEGQGK